MNEVLTRNRELQNEQNVNLETLARWGMEFQQWAHDQFERLRQELGHKINEVKQLQQLACSQAKKIEQMGFEIDNKVVMVIELQRELENKIGEVKELQQQLENKIREVNWLQHELDNKNDEVKELKQADDLIVNRLQGAWDSGFVAGRAEERSVHVLAPPICATSQ